MEETKEVMLPKPLVDELVVAAVKERIEKIEAGDEPFIPVGIQATEDVAEVVKQEWIYCLPRPAEFCRLQIIGNSLVITPVQITDIP